MKRWSFPLIAVLGTLGAICFARAAATTASVPVPVPSPTETVQEQTLETPDGPQHFFVHEAKNANGELEVQIEHEELRTLIPGSTRAVVLYGRDLDGDGKIDAWFYPDESGVIQAVDLPPSSDNAWDNASPIILQQDQYKNRWFAGLLTTAILSRMTLTEGMAQNLNQDLLQEEIDLRDLEIRVARLQKENPRDPSILQYDILLTDSWANISQRISSEGIRDRFLYAAGDIGLYLSGAVLAKGFGVAMKWGIPQILASAPGAWAGAAYDSLCAELSEISTKASANLGAQAEKLGIDSDAIRWPTDLSLGGAAQTVADTLRDRIPSVIRGLGARGRVAVLLSQAAEKSIDALKAVGGGIFQRWKYIAATQTLQLGTEIYNRRDTLFSPNPIVFAKRVVTDKDLLQDLTFMTLDTTVQTGVSAADSNVKRRMIVCSVLSLVDSGTANLIINKSPDLGRSALDTGWEMSIGNIDTQIDMTALQKFEALAAEQGNPKLALIGYAISLSVDTAENFAYEKTTNRYENDKSAGAPMFSWVPIFGQK